MPDQKLPLHEQRLASLKMISNISENILESCDSDIMKLVTATLLVMSWWRQRELGHFLSMLAEALESTTPSKPALANGLIEFSFCSSTTSTALYCLCVFTSNLVLLIFSDSLMTA
jgi:hypothetical protein